MDPHAYDIAKTVAHRWLDSNKSWNYGRYHADVAPEFYTLLGLDFNRDKHDGQLKARVTKNLKRVWEEVLSEKVYEGDPQMAQKAAQILGQFEKTSFIFNNVVFQGNVNGGEVNIANQQGESSSPHKRKACSTTPIPEKESPPPPPYEVPPHKKHKRDESSSTIEDKTQAPSEPPATVEDKCQTPDESPANVEDKSQTPDAPVDNADDNVDDNVDESQESSELPENKIKPEEDSFIIPSDFFATFDAISSDCDGCCAHPTDCDGCCMHPPTEVLGSSPSSRRASASQESGAPPQEPSQDDGTSLAVLPAYSHSTRSSQAPATPRSGSPAPSLSAALEAPASSPPPSGSQAEGPTSAANSHADGPCVPTCPCAARVERLEKLAEAQQWAIRGLKEFLLQRHETEKRLLTYLDALENVNTEHAQYTSENSQGSGSTSQRTRHR